MTPLLEIGGVARAHGIRGEVAIVTHDPDSTILERCGSVWIDGVERAVVAARDTQRGWLVQLEGVTTRTEAEALRGRPVEVERDKLELEDDDVLLHDLVGCEARLADGTRWGEIVAVEVGGGPAPQDRLVVHDGDVERLLPLVDRFVTAIDVEGKLVTVDPPPGLPETSRADTQRAGRPDKPTTEIGKSKP